ncbi:MaoC family dehydratase [Hyphobacterium sp.]|uniref:MaoC family dehydratase n=1 Tax=Hyphobacterium sp. TaxID=2004662 RepID=UPI003BA99BB3
MDDYLTKVGETYSSDWFEMSQDKVDAFADLTIDHNFIHVDVERSKTETPFGGTIAHGYFTLSMLSHLGETCLPAFPPGMIPMNYGFEKIRFSAPTPVGKRIRAHFKLSKVEERKAGQWLSHWDVTVEVEGQEAPAIRAHWLTLFLSAG